MEQEQTSPTPSSGLMAEVKERRAARVSVKTTVVLILISILAGMGGGVYGAAYLVRQPNVQKLLFGDQDNSQAISQNITLNEDSVVSDVVKKTREAVVSVVISKDLNRLRQFGYDPFGLNQTQTQTPNIQQVGAGSGFFVSDDGLIMTNRHVVSDTQATYTVVTNDGKSYEAQVLARDPINDLAILKISISNASHLTFADSDSLELGQTVVAIGNSLGQYQNTVTSGIVSGIGRSITAGDQEGSEELEGVIQTDAAINPGNSGGPLLNIIGQVVGINTAVDLQGQLVGFAIPANDIKQALESFQKTGKISRPFLGVRYITLTKAITESEQLPVEYGALLVRGASVTDFAVAPGSPADKAGLRENDIILDIGGTRLDGDHTLSRELRKYRAGDTVTLKVYSQGNEKTVSVTLGETE
jgi:serine protease Do